MKWFCGYWGVGIEAETEEDITLLRTLVDALPEKAYSSYENSIVKLIDCAAPDSGYTCDGLALIFER